MKKVLVFLILTAAASGYLGFRHMQRSLIYLDSVAEEQVRLEERKNLTEGIKKKYPHLSKMLQAKMAGSLFERYWMESLPVVGQKVAQKRDELKSRYQNNNGQTYLSGLDSYYWLRLLRNKINYGQAGESRLYGMSFDRFLNAPLERTIERNVHLNLGYGLYRCVSRLLPGVDLESVVFYVPILLTIFLIYWIYGVLKLMGSDDFGAIAGSLSVALSPFLMIRCNNEWYDTDIYNIFFPVVTLGFLVAAHKVSKLWARIMCLMGCWFSLALYAATWKGWWFIFDILLISEILFLLNLYESRREEGVDALSLRRVRNLVFGFVTGSLVAVGLYAGWPAMADVVLEPLRLSSVLRISEQAHWPNTYWTVAELTPISAMDLLRNLGGSFFFFFSLGGFLWLFLRTKVSRDVKSGIGFWCMGIWVLSVYLVSLSAGRFALLLVAPVGMLLGLSVSTFRANIMAWNRRHLNPVRQKIAGACVSVLIGCSVSTFIFGHFGSWMTFSPPLTDEWNSVLTKMKTTTPEDAVINSWWDFGHWFTAIAQRRVLFDGMTQNTPYAYWMAGALLTAQEQESVGILRMINSNGNSAVEFLTQHQGWLPSKAIEMLRQLVVMSEDQARVFLKGQMPADSIEVLLGYVFPTKLSSAYLIVSSDMIPKLRPISFIGYWDFKKVDLWMKQKQLGAVDQFVAYAAKTYNMSSQEAQEIWSEMSLLNEQESRSWYSSSIGPQTRDVKALVSDDLLFFDTGLVVDLANHKARVVSEFIDRKGVPQKLIVFDKGIFEDFPQSDATLDESALLYKEGDEYKSILLDERLAKSMTVRLYYLKGEGLSLFEFFDEQQDKDGNKICVYKIRWP